MFVADVKCSQATWQTVPNSRTGSAKAYVSEAVVRTWQTGVIFIALAYTTGLGYHPPVIIII